MSIVLWGSLPMSCSGAKALSSSLDKLTYWRDSFAFSQSFWVPAAVIQNTGTETRACCVNRTDFCLSGYLHLRRPHTIDWVYVRLIRPCVQGGCWLGLRPADRPLCPGLLLKEADSGIVCAPVTPAAPGSRPVPEEACGDLVFALQHSKLCISRDSHDHVNGGGVSPTLNGT